MFLSKWKVGRIRTRLICYASDVHLKLGPIRPRKLEVQLTRLTDQLVIWPSFSHGPSMPSRNQGELYGPGVLVHPEIPPELCFPLQPTFKRAPQKKKNIPEWRRQEFAPLIGWCKGGAHLPKLATDSQNSFASLTTCQHRLFGENGPLENSPREIHLRRLKIEIHPLVVEFTGKFTAMQRG